MVIRENALDLIGNTPLVDVSNLSPNPRVRLLAKLENQNPFGSVKDRIAKSMIEQAEKNGKLSPGQRIIEPSSGNTGIALAAIAQIKGYPITILMQETPVGVFFGHLFGAQNCAIRTFGAGSNDHLRAENLEHLSSLNRNIVGHQNCYRIPLDLRNRRQRDARVST